jgi:hypothetical protein
VLGIPPAWVTGEERGGRGVARVFRQRLLEERRRELGLSFLDRRPCPHVEIVSGDQSVDAATSRVAALRRRRSGYRASDDAQRLVERGPPGFVHGLGLLRGDVDGLGRVAFQVVQLRHGAADEFLLRRPQRAKRRPAVGPLAEQRLGVDDLALGSVAAEKARGAAFALHRRHGGKTHELEKRRDQIDARDQPIEFRPGGDPRRVPDDHRHAQRAVVEEQPVGFLAVLAQALAVVRRHDDHRVVQDPRRPEVVEEALELRVGVRDVTVVQAFGEARAVLRRRKVRNARVVELHPDEERPALDLVDRLDRVGDDELSGPGQAFRLGVAIEPLLQADVPREDVRPDRRGGRIPLRLQVLRERRRRVKELEAAVVPHAVRRRVEAGEDRHMRRKRQWGDGDRLGEDRALARELIDAGCPGEGIAVAPEVVGPGRLQRDEDEVGFHPARLERRGQRGGADRCGGLGLDRLSRRRGRLVFRTGQHRPGERRCNQGARSGRHFPLFSRIPFRSMIVFWSETITLILSDSLSTYR